METCHEYVPGETLISESQDRGVSGRSIQAPTTCLNTHEGVPFAQGNSQIACKGRDGGQ